MTGLRSNFSGSSTFNPVSGFTSPGYVSGPIQEGVGDGSGVELGSGNSVGTTNIVVGVDDAEMTIVAVGGIDVFEETGVITSSCDDSPGLASLLLQAANTQIMIKEPTTTRRN
jgi:hypothetical protein